MRITILLLAFIFAQASAKNLNNGQLNTLPSFGGNRDKIWVVAHRGDWRNAPENSLKAIQNCIDLGVDMVEIDIRKTKDGALVLMHDESVDRTTNGTGRVENLSLNELKKLRLKNHQGKITNHTIPTLEEALQLCKDKIWVNLDKSYSLVEKCYVIAQATGTTEQIIFKGKVPFPQAQKKLGSLYNKILFMPIISLPNPKRQQIIDGYLNNMKPIAFEFTIPHDSIAVQTLFSKLREKNIAVWVNSMWPHHNAGHEDDKALKDLKVYEWYIKNRINIIQTDRPRLLLNYLRNIGRHK